VHYACRPRGDEPESREAVTTVERTFLDERPSVLASASAPAAVVPSAHAYVVGQRPVPVQTTGILLADQGISVSVFGFELPGTTSPTSKINCSNTGTTSANGEGMATALRNQKVSVSQDQKVPGVKARGIPPRGRPV